MILQCIRFKYLQKTITDESKEDLFAMALLDVARVGGRKHRREVEQGHVGLSVMIQLKGQIWKLIICAVITGVFDVIQQSILIDILPAQQLDRVFVVL